MPDVSIRTVIEETRFTNDLDNYRRLYPNVDKVYLEMTWLLATQPRVGEALDFAPDFWRYQTSAVGEVSPFWILYTFDDNHVWLQSMEPIKI
jgi:hypothetical protein